jgi:glycine betaine/proline transport system permease protein
MNYDNEITKFVKTNSPYYIKEFTKIGNSSKRVFSFNFFAALLGPVWFGSRNIWNYALAFLILETFSIVQVMRGFFGNVTTEIYAKIAGIESTLVFRNKQLSAAYEKAPEKVEVFKRAIESLEKAVTDYKIEAKAIEESAIYIAIFGLLGLFSIKIIQGLVANHILEKKFSNYLSDTSISAEIKSKNIFFSFLLTVIIIVFTSLHYAFPDTWSFLNNFPTHPDIRLISIKWIETAFNFATLEGDAFFDGISHGIRSVLDFLELLFLGTPWIVIFSIIVLLTTLSAGPRAGIITGSFLAYMGLLGFWKLAMITIALLNTAAALSIIIGIPLGIYCSRRPKFYSFIRPIMDFMQTMPAFVFMIPVIAFFGVGKVAAVLITMIFGGTPVVRFTVLALKGVPENVREAAISYGASKWYLLRKVDLPLAAPTIMAGVNQTVLLSLTMVVVASLVGAKGLGLEVLEALQYTNVGQGILAGIAILFCALILDKIVQGKKN